MKRKEQLNPILIVTYITTRNSFDDPKSGAPIKATIKLQFEKEKKKKERKERKKGRKRKEK